MQAESEQPLIFTAVSGQVKSAESRSWSSHSEALRESLGNGRADIVLRLLGFYAGNI